MDVALDCETVLDIAGADCLPDHHVPVRFKPKIRTFEPRYRGKVSPV
ncbi:hypothetical protein [Sinorhizobium meliloti]|nr:hypothetical protein [Sinorhizobium meliloti]MDW9646125.1 hypothetical protein [Sinorhizobium meliloti]